MKSGLRKKKSKNKTKQRKTNLTTFFSGVSFFDDDLSPVPYPGLISAGALYVNKHEQFHIAVY